MKPFLSAGGINPGATWFSKISSELECAIAGIVCVTHENKDRPWILFEAGALHNGMGDDAAKILLIDLEPKDIDDPLAQFQVSRVSDRENMRSLFTSVVKDIDPGLQPDPENIDKYFDREWDSFCEGILEDVKEHKSPGRAEPPEREQGEKIDEILRRVRNIEQLRIQPRSDFERLRRYADAEPFKTHDQTKQGIRRSSHSGIGKYVDDLVSKAKGIFLDEGEVSARSYLSSRVPGSDPETVARFMRTVRTELRESGEAE